MRTAIRLDDITIDMDWQRFRRIEKILDDAGIRPLIGVVPCCEDDNLSRMQGSESWDKEVLDSVPKDEVEWIDFLKSLTDKGWLIALHGYKHVYTTKNMGLFPLNNFSEYAGVPYYAQLNMIKEGLKQLKAWNIDTDIFMAPGHTFDMNTLRALAASGISRMTDGFGRNPYKRIVRNSGRTEGIKFYPISVKSSDCTSDKEGYTTLVVHCNTMEDADIEAFKEKITEYREHFIDFGEYLREGGEVRGAFGNVLEYLIALSKFMFTRLRTFIRTSGDDDTEDDEDMIEDEAKEEKHYD